MKTTALATSVTGIWLVLLGVNLHVTSDDWLAAIAAAYVGVWYCCQEWHRICHLTGWLYQSYFRIGRWSDTAPS
jgi:hypothetical protein